MECFADGLGLPHDIFTDGTVECGENDCQNVLRLLHYHATEGKHFGPNFWRAGAHADFDILTIVRLSSPSLSPLPACPTGRHLYSSCSATVKAASRFVPAEKSSATSVWARLGSPSRLDKIRLCVT